MWKYRVVRVQNGGNFGGVLDRSHACRFSHIYKPIISPYISLLAYNHWLQICSKRTVRVGQTIPGLVVSKSDDKQVLLLTLESLSKLLILYDQYVFYFIFTVASVDPLLIKSRISLRPGWNRYVYSPLTFSCAINGFMKGIHKYYFITFLILVLPGVFHYQIFVSSVKLEINCLRSLYFFKEW